MHGNQDNFQKQFKLELESKKTQECEATSKGRELVERKKAENSSTPVDRKEGKQVMFAKVKVVRKAYFSTQPLLLLFVKRFL